MIGRAWSEFADSSNSSDQFVQGVKFRFQGTVKLRKYACPEQFTSSVVVSFTQTSGKSERRVAIAGSGGLRHFQQSVRNLGHCTNHHHGGAIEASFNDRCGALDGLGV